MEYYTITTNAGDQSIAKAIQSGTTTTFKQMEPIMIPQKRKQRSSMKYGVGTRLLPVMQTMPKGLLLQ